jgi:hypothetical protein
MAKRRTSEETLRRAVKYSYMPGVTSREVCARFGLSPRTLTRARKDAGAEGHLSVQELVLTAITKRGAVTEGTVGDLASIAAFVDWQNHDGCKPDDVAATLTELEQSGLVILSGSHFRLVDPWP